MQFHVLLSVLPKHAEMVKQRMNVADVACEVACLKKRIIGMRVANIYDLSPKVAAS